MLTNSFIRRMTPTARPKRPQSLAKICEMGRVRSFWPNARPHEAHRKSIPVTLANATIPERLTLDPTRYHAA